MSHWLSLMFRTFVDVNQHFCGDSHVAPAGLVHLRSSSIRPRPVLEVVFAVKNIEQDRENTTTACWPNMLLRPSSPFRTLHDR